MITAIDTNVLHDVLAADAKYGRRSAATLERCISEGSLVACEVVWAEAAAVFPVTTAFREAMTVLGVPYSALSIEAAVHAGETWRRYRSRGGRRERVAADFLIGSHALLQADRLLTRDRGFYRDYFSKLKVIDPTE
jgi:predicted nucleic acid-binding protein